MAEPSPTLELADLSNPLRRVEGELLRAVETDDAELTEIAGHLLRAGGKRVRPRLTLAAALTSPSSDPTTLDRAVLGAAAVELVHLGSLYHDDVLDDAPTRRQVESVNARWGNLKAILAGDFLLAKSAELAAALGTDVAALLARTIGQLCEGQVRELEYAFDLDRSDRAYFHAIEAKTSALLATSCRIGGLVAELAPQELDAVTAFGRDFGMAFQIVDDVLDVVGNRAAIGKPTGADLAAGNYTLPVLLARDGIHGDVLRRLIAAEDVPAAANLIRSNGAIPQAIDVAGRYIDDALATLEPLGDTPGTTLLRASARNLLDALPTPTA